MMKRGNVVFVKKAIGLRQGRGAPSVDCKEPVAALVLGLAPKDIAWDEKLLAQSLATLGLYYGDDVEECLGPKAIEKLIKFVEQKYKDTP